MKQQNENTTVQLINWEINDPTLLLAKLNAIFPGRHFDSAHLSIIATFQKKLISDKEPADSNHCINIICLLLLNQLTPSHIEYYDNCDDSTLTTWLRILFIDLYTELITI